MTQLREKGSHKALLDHSTGALAKYRFLVVGSDRWWYLIKFELITSLLISFPGALGLWLRKIFYPALFRSCGQNVIFGRNVTLRHPLRVSLGDNVIVHDDVTLDGKGREGNGISIGDNVFLGKGTMLASVDGTININEDASIGCYCRIGSSKHTTIGKKALLASYVYVVGADHDSTRTDIPVIDQPNVSRGGATIGDGTWIGTKSTVLDGVSVGSDCIVGAHSLVTKDVPDFSVIVGSPAKVIRDRRDQ